MTRVVIAANAVSKENVMQVTPRIVNCLWFDDRAEEAAKYYVSIFKNAKILRISRYGKVGVETHKMPPGSVMTVEFQLDGQSFTALNGGPLFTFNEAISLQVLCDTQEEMDYYWDKLSQGGDPNSHVCGWLKDKYGLSWQVIPRKLAEWAMDGESPKSQRVMEVVLRSKKLDMRELERAYAG